MTWTPASSAPFDRDLELAVIDRSGMHALVFPCRRILCGWIDAQTKRRLELDPTHWREWKPSNRAMLLDHLAEAERHVDLGAAHVERQREIVTELERDGHDAASARNLLGQFEQMQKLHMQHRERLVAELGD